ncbi:hypothetical protein [Lonepinella sp. BR2474]|uniref:hypothetical protein n=1 Tax=Lonepinella sp. BR2474 TaxID=3434548 RepID=UPI003F6DB373
MNKYEALGRLAETEQQLTKARQARALLAEQIHQKSEMLRLRHKDSDEITHFTNAAKDVEILLESYQAKNQEVAQQLDYIAELKNFC